jgi:hypothetical protein
VEYRESFPFRLHRFPPPQEEIMRIRTTVPIIAARRRFLVRSSVAANPRPRRQNAEKGDIGKEKRPGPEDAETEGAVVVTVTFTVTAAEPPSAAEDFESVQVALDGAPVQVSCTVPAKPPPEFSVRTDVTVSPALIELEFGASDIEKSGGPDQPISGRTCVPGAKLSVKVMLPLLAPFAVGVEVTLAVQP